MTGPSQPSPVRSRSLAKKIFDKQKSRAEADSKRIAIFSAVLGLLVSGIIIGFLVPIQIDMAAVQREDKNRCWESLITLRESTDDLEKGFIIQPSTPIPRNADLDTVRLGIENARFACEGVFPFDDPIRQTEAYIKTIDDLKNRTSAGEFVTSIDFVTTGFVSDVHNWSKSTMQRLSQ